MAEEYRWWLHMMTKERPRIEVHASGDDLDDIEAAHVGDKIVSYWQHECGLTDTEETAASDSLVQGISYIAPVWRRNGQQITEILEYSEQPVESKGVKSNIKRVKKTSGDMAFDNYNSLNTNYFPIGATHWGEVTHLVTAQLVTLEYLEAAFGKSFDPDKLEPVDPSRLNLEAISQASLYIDEAFGFRSEDQEHKQYLMVQYRERAGNDDRGRYVIYVGEQLMHDGDLPYVDNAREIDPNDVYNVTMGLIPFPLFKDSSRLVPQSKMAALIPSQIELNQLKTDEARLRLASRPKLLAPQGMLDEDQWTDEYGELIELNPEQLALGAPTWVDGPQQGMMMAADSVMRKQREFQERAGRPPITQGKNDTQVRSALHASVLAEAAEIPIDIIITQREKVLSTLIKLTMSISRQRYTKNKLIEIYGQDHGGRVEMFRKAKLRQDVRVVPGSGKPVNHAAKKLEILELARAGVLNDPKTGVPDQYMLFQMLDLSTERPEVDELWRERSRAENDCLVMLSGIAVIPSKWQDHNLRMTICQSFMNRRNYEEATDSVKALFIAYLDEHAEMFNDSQPGLGMGAEVDDAELGPEIERADAALAGRPQPNLQLLA